HREGLLRPGGSRAPTRHARVDGTGARQRPVLRLRRRELRRGSIRSMTASPPAVFFDLDGTLTDPLPRISRSFQHAMQALGRPVPEVDDLRSCIGPPIRPSFARLLDSTSDDLVDAAIALYRERYAAIGMYANSVYPGIPEVVTAVRASGYRTFVVTSKLHVFATRIVEHFSLASLFDRIYGSELDGTRVDKGELIAYALAEEQLGPSDVVMVGDREHDVIGAVKCGV